MVFKFDFIEFCWSSCPSSSMITVYCLRKMEQNLQHASQRKHATKKIKQKSGTKTGRKKNDISSHVYWLKEIHTPRIRHL